MTSKNEKVDSQLPFKIVIKKGHQQDSAILQKLAISTFRESHGHSAAPEDIQSYINFKFSLEILTLELLDSINLFYLICVDDEIVGYSKIIFNSIYNEKTPNDSAKMERLYILQKYHGTELGRMLMDYNIQLAKENNQSGLWLYVWTENHKAIRFYEKYGFYQIAETVFQISERHGNPNKILYLKF